MSTSPLDLPSARSVRCAKRSPLSVRCGRRRSSTCSTLLFAPNLAWRNEPLRDAVAALVGLPVVVENDANAAAWGEFRFGAGKGEDHLLCVTVGTGIGGGIVLGGQLYRGRYGVAAE